MDTRPPYRAYWAPPMVAQTRPLAPPRRLPKRPIVATVAVAVLLVITIAYLGSGEKGRYYIYDYFVEVDDVTGAFCVTVPVPVLPNGTAFPRLRFDRDLPAECELVPTHRGLGLEVRGSGRTLVSLEGEYNACLLSDDHVSDADPRLSMTTLNSTMSPPGDPTVAWVLSDVGGLNVTVWFKVLWGNWVETPLGGRHVRGGSGFDQSIQGETVAGWSEHLVDTAEIEVD